ncbi:MAG: hypothetical protein COA70_12195 [Planctomycetota bacterium]|nr:MAG: hypothetical protein COA70_12195 [Planctomycetota bacterium]
MNNRTTLYLLMGLALAAVAGRFWSVSYRSDWDSALENHKRSYKIIWETSDDLAVRRENAPKSNEEFYFRAHFQAQAYDPAQMGTIDVKMRERSQKNYEDKIFEIEFQEGDAGFRRDQMRAFLFNSELLMPRVRTTTLNLQPVSQDGRGRKLDTGVEREDLWKITKLNFRQRSPVANR